MNRKNGNRLGANQATVLREFNRAAVSDEQHGNWAKSFDMHHCSGRLHITSVAWYVSSPVGLKGSLGPGRLRPSGFYFAMI